MSWPHLAIYGVVFGIGLPAAFRNPTALALCLSWMAGEAVWLLTGDNLSLKIYFMADVAVIALIYAKATRCIGARVFTSFRNQLRGFVSELTVWDRFIVALFLLGAWPAYLSGIHPYYAWWLLWAITILQFLCAGAEAIQLQSLRHKQARVASEPPDSFALAGYGSYG